MTKILYAGNHPPKQEQWLEVGADLLPDAMRQKLNSFYFFAPYPSDGTEERDLEIEQGALEIAQYADAEGYDIVVFDVFKKNNLAVSAALFYASDGHIEGFECRVTSPSLLINQPILSRMIAADTFLAYNNQTREGWLEDGVTEVFPNDDRSYDNWMISAAAMRVINTSMDTASQRDGEHLLSQISYGCERMARRPSDLISLEAITSERFYNLNCSISGAILAEQLYSSGEIEQAGEVVERLHIMPAQYKRRFSSTYLISAENNADLEESMVEYDASNDPMGAYLKMAAGGFEGVTNHEAEQVIDGMLAALEGGFALKDKQASPSYAHYQNFNRADTGFDSHPIYSSKQVLHATQELLIRFASEEQLERYEQCKWAGVAEHSAVIGKLNMGM